MTRKAQRFLKVALSLFVCVQILTIFVCPNPDSIIYRYFENSLIVYGNLFGINTTWRFFSPDPNVRLLEYEVFTRGPDGHLQGESFRYPKALDEEPSREIYNRKMNNEMYVIARNMVDKTIGPQLCKWHPNAESIAIYMSGRVFPTIEKSVFLGRHVSDLGEIKRDYLMDMNCHETAQ